MSDSGPLDLTPVNVALGGGGAKGFAHIGVLGVLAERCEITSLVCTSMGAIIGALYARHFVHRSTAGQFTVAEQQQTAVIAVHQVIEAQNFFSFIDPSWSPFIAGLVHGRGFSRWLRHHLAVKGRPLHFGELDFDLTITATDATTGNSLQLNRDETPALLIADAVRASMSIPFVFEPVVIDYRGQRTTCWDGGVTGNCRFDLARKRNTNNLTIASSVTYRGEYRDVTTGVLRSLLRYFRTNDHVSDIMLRQMEAQLADALGEEVMRQVLVVQPPLGTTNTFSFRTTPTRLQEFITQARLSTQHALDTHMKQAARE